MATENEHKSATAWVTKTPVNPKSFGNIIISGIKNKPLRADDVIVALKPLPIDCNIILVITMVTMVGRTTV